MKYLSHDAILWSIDELSKGTHPFIGITLLACKKARIPVGRATEVSLDAVTREHLDTHHRLDPQSEFYFQPFKSNKRWVAPKYPSAGLQGVNTRTFRAVFIHQKQSSSWGFKEDYIDRIQQIIEESPGSQPTSLPAISIWIGKSVIWDEGDTLTSVVERFVGSHHISPAELTQLFSSTGQPTLGLTEEALFNEYPPDLKAVAYNVTPPPDAPGQTEGTLAAIHLTNVGPAKKFDLDFGKRLTVIAGDNGLGKSFLLDVAWWAITGQWATEQQAVPFGEPQERMRPAIGFEIRNNVGRLLQGSSSFGWKTHSWRTQGDRSSVAALCIFARVDGSFAVSDKMRARLGFDDQSYVNRFTVEEVWDGKAGEIEGLVRDWVNWQLLRDQDVFSKLTRVLERLSPEDLGNLVPGEPRRIPGDTRQIPTIKHPYGDVPIVFASAGVQRILALAYVTIWSWQEHTLAAQQIGEEPFRRMVVLVDEIEAHLHPRWQRTMLPALMSVGKMLSEHLEMQIIVSTHSPMILASIESDFSDASDALYHLELKESDVVLKPLEFQKYGNIGAWLTSPVFGLRQARSLEAEQVIEEAKAVQLSHEPDASQIRTVSDKLRRLLAPDDSFWPRWIFFAEQFGINL